MDRTGHWYAQIAEGISIPEEDWPIPHNFPTNVMFVKDVGLGFVMESPKAQQQGRSSVETYKTAAQEAKSVHDFEEWATATRKMNDLREKYRAGEIDASQVKEDYDQPASPNSCIARVLDAGFKPIYTAEVPLGTKFPITGGLKNDSNKPRMELLDADFLEDVARVLTEGAKVYSANNWRSGLSYGRILGAILRHTMAILRGNDIDSQFGLSHTAHLACEVMFLHFMIKNRKDLDDRWRKE